MGTRSSFFTQRGENLTELVTPLLKVGQIGDFKKCGQALDAKERLR